MHRLRPGLAAALLAIGLLAACSGSGPQTLQRVHSTEQYVPGVDGRLFLPARSPRPTTLVVLLPGGGWRTADAAGLRPLADRLAGDGLTAATASYRTASDGAHYPRDAEDAACAVAWAAQRARQAGFRPTRVVVVGHSAGAHLAALVALVPTRLRGTCPYPRVAVSAFAGFAGPYDIARFRPMSGALVGEPLAAAPAAWRVANAMTWVARRPDVPALLVQGTADTVVDPSFTREFAAALRRAGHPVRTDYVPDASHGAIYRASLAGPILERWLPTLH